MTDFQDYIVCESDYYNNATSQISFPVNFNFVKVENLNNGSFCQMSEEQSTTPFNQSGALQAIVFTFYT